MSKYAALWRRIAAQSGDVLELSFAEIERIAGLSLDHSFLNYKKDAEQFGYRVEKISLKQKWVAISRIHEIKSKE